MEMDGQIDATAILSLRKGSRIRLKCTMGWPQNRSGRFGRKFSCPVRIRALGCPNLSLVTIPTTISVLYSAGKWVKYSLSTVASPLKSQIWINILGSFILLFAVQSCVA